MKNIFELEGVINSRDRCYNFLNRSVPLFPKEHTRKVLKSKEQRIIKVEAPFFDEISGLAIINFLDRNTHSTMVLELKFILNK